MSQVKVQAEELFLSLGGAVSLECFTDGDTLANLVKNPKLRRTFPWKCLCVSFRNNFLSYNKLFNYLKKNTHTHWPVLPT